MKFRALLSDSAAMKDFLNIVVGLSKFSKVCVMRINERKLYFIISEEESGPKKPLVWCELPVNFYFKEYNVIGMNEHYNEIYLEFSTILLARSLSVIKQNVQSLKIKLTNKESPCLTLEIELMAGELVSRQCVHDIPVDVISRKHWPDYEEPRFNDFHVSIEMPNLRSIKTIVEHMKTMSNQLIVTANRSGRLTFKIQTNIVKLSTHFQDLNVESFAVGQIPSLQDANDETCVNSTVDMKKFFMFLSGMQFNMNCKCICSIVHENMVKLSMKQQDAFSLQIFLTEIMT